MLIAALALSLLMQDPRSLLMQDPSEAAIDCTQAVTTLDMNTCAAADLDAAEQRMQDYFERVLLTVGDDAEGPQEAATIRAELLTAQKAWQDYVEADCGAVYTYWQGGTIRVMMALGCKLALTEARTHHLWESYLRTMDGQDLLPEPLPLADGAIETAGD